jgi:hypothetical protein
MYVIVPRTIALEYIRHAAVYQNSEVVSVIPAEPGRAAVWRVLQPAGSVLPSRQRDSESPDCR